MMVEILSLIFRLIIKVFLVMAILACLTWVYFKVGNSFFDIFKGTICLPYTILLLAFLICLLMAIILIIAIPAILPQPGGINGL